MSADDTGTSLTTWLDTWQPESAALLTARARAAEVGVRGLDAAGGAALRILAAASGARAVIELGTGAGISALYLLDGMPQDGILTTIDAESEHQRLAKQSLTEAGYPSGRVRLIAGRALEVLPRLSDSAYDLVFCDAARSENRDYLEAAVRVLRPGGLVVFAGALNGGKVAEPHVRDADTVGMRDLLKTVRDDERFTSAVLPVGAGLLVATTT
jgi:predicted O-methyltransferase YrrM